MLSGGDKERALLKDPNWKELAAVRFDFELETVESFVQHCICLLMGLLCTSLGAFPDCTCSSFLTNVAQIRLLGLLFLTLHK